MPASTITPSPKQAKSSTTETILNELRRLTPEQRAEIAKRLAEKPAPLHPLPRTPAGGLAANMTIDDLLEHLVEVQDEYSDRPGRYHFSSVGQCFRKQWYKGKKVTCDCGLMPNTCPTHRFDPGKSEPGHAVENHLRVLRSRAYTTDGEGDGVVLKDIRLSEAIEVPTADGTGIETIYATGKSDDIIAGDNMEVLDFTELKSPIFWTKSKTAFLEKNGKVVPLFLAKIGDIVGLNNALQLAIGCQILADHGHPPKQVTLIYINRERYREHIQILFTPEEVKFLHDLAIWWIREHHQNMQSDVPPAPQFLMGWECKDTYCPFVERCVAQCKSEGSTRSMHPVAIGINERMNPGHEPNPGDIPPAEQPAAVKPRKPSEAQEREAWADMAEATGNG